MVAPASPKPAGQGSAPSQTARNAPGGTLQAPGDGFGRQAAMMGQLQEGLAKTRAQKQTGRFGGKPTGALLGEIPGGGERAEESEGNEEAETGQDEPMQGQVLAQQAAMAERLQSMKQMARTKADQALESKEGQQAKDKLQKEVRKTAKVAIRRGVEYVINFVCGSIDTGTVGVSLIVDIFIYAFTLVDLNIQMIWGYYIAKGKSLLFPALDWTPLKVPLPVILLHAGLVLFDITLVLLIGTLLLTTMIILFLPQLVAAVGLASVYKFATDPAFRTIISNMIPP